MKTNKGFNNKEIFNEILFETKNFKVIPSLGSLVEGWLLIVPKDYYLCFGKIKSKELNDELNYLIDHVTQIIKNEYGNYIIFEHGPIEELTLVGCGVDYAHIHIVPIELDLSTINSISKSSWNWDAASGIEDSISFHDNGIPYIYFQDNFGSKYIGTSSKIPSQFFRRIISDILGVPEKFNWKEFYLLDNISATYAKLAKYKKNISELKLLEHA
jgi:ATP adenylyltransferase